MTTKTYLVMTTDNTPNYGDVDLVVDLVAGPTDEDMEAIEASGDNTACWAASEAPTVGDRVRTAPMQRIHDVWRLLGQITGDCAPLVAHHDTTGYSVADVDGGCWRPSDEAADEIGASVDPTAAALEMATSEPMRGTWTS